MESTFWGINVVNFWIGLFLAVCMFLFMFLMGAVMSWSERKQSAQMQDRIGANRAGIPLPGGRKLTFWGFVNNIADATKNIVKENFKPKAYDFLMYNIAIFMAFIPVTLSIAVIPFAGEVRLAEFFDVWYLKWIPSLLGFTVPNYKFYVQVANLNVGLLFVFAMGGMGIFGAIVAGWASNNKFSMLGGLRAAAQMISYEIAMGLSLLGLIFIYQEVNMLEIVKWQDTHAWGIFVQPVAFFLFMTAAAAENKRAPFDLPEAESEIISGYFTEYSAFKALMFMFAEFIEIALVAVLLTTLFFGGYSVPLLDASTNTWAGIWELSHATVVILQLLAFLGKVLFFCWLLQMIRWSLPRFRYDQLMKLGWKGLLPLSLVNLIITVVVVALV